MNRAARPHATDGPRPTYPGEAERRLWAAVLESTRHELHSDTPGDSAYYVASGAFYPGSFTWICEYLGLDAGAVRRAFLLPPSPRPTDPRPR